jgi:hypothetical protein
MTCFIFVREEVHWQEPESTTAGETENSSEQSELILFLLFVPEQS